MTTVPAVPSTVIMSPSEIRVVATWVPTTQGIAYSRAQIAECESSPPMSVTTPPAIAKRGVQGGAVLRQTRISPACSVSLPASEWRIAGAAADDSLAGGDALDNGAF